LKFVWTGKTITNMAVSCLVNIIIQLRRYIKMAVGLLYSYSREKEQNCRPWCISFISAQYFFLFKKKKGSWIEHRTFGRKEKRKVLRFYSNHVDNITVPLRAKLLTTVIFPQFCLGMSGSNLMHLFPIKLAKSSTKYTLTWQSLRAARNGMVGYHHDSYSFFFFQKSHALLEIRQVLDHNWQFP